MTKKAISCETSKGMIFKRKEVKAHGTSKLIEGVFKQNDKCLVIEDVVTSGSSIIETVKELRENGGLVVNDAIVLLNREQGGAENIANINVKLHSILKTSDVLNILLKNKCIDQVIYDKTSEFLDKNRHVPVPQNLSAKAVEVKSIHFI